MAGGESDQPDRPKLVALPASSETAAEPEPGSARAAGTTADAAAAAALAETERLALERSLSGPPVPGARIAAAPLPRAAAATDFVTPTTAHWASQPHGIADAIAITATPELVPALRAELAMRAHAEAGLRTRAVDAETRLAARVLLSQRTAETLVQVRAELDQLAGLLTDERGRRQAAEQRITELERQLDADRGRSDDAAVEIASLRDSLLALQAPPEDQDVANVDGESPTDRSQSATAEVRADRLSDALTRLRASTEPIDPAPRGSVEPSGLTSATAVVPATGPRAALSGPFRTLCRRDPALAGQLALSLLALQRIAYPRPVAYDIVLGPGHGCVQVTSAEGATEIARQATARPLQQVDLQLVGGPERFAKLLAVGRIRRRLGFGVARVRGNRDGLAALDALLAMPLDLVSLVAGGMSTDPSILLSLVAAIVSPDWTRGARFSISHHDSAAAATYLLVADGRRPTVTTVAPTGPIATVISCERSDLASVLTGSPTPEPASVQVAGDPAPLAQLQAWIKRAQSD
jgi:hypothetical protein